jgi:hypothetical protein
MFIFELFEAPELKHASFCFGRMNPPTIGHKQLIDTVAKSAHSGKYFIFVSHSQDAKKNPLDPQTKIHFLQKMFPEHAKHIVDRAGITTALHAATMLYDAGINSVTFVAGSDRMAQFQKLLTDYNGVEGKAHGYYKFENIEFASSGDRDPDADGLAGISASRAREAAAAGDIKAFAEATGAGKLTDELYAAVRAGMKIKENTVNEDGNKCPPATQDITLNLKNRQKAINEYGYGPLNPDMPNTKFWMKKVDEWNLDSAQEAKESLCGNCAAFDVRQQTLDCIAQGIDSDNPEDAKGVIDAGDLGYCKFLKFKCASRRTCDAWVTGGPLTDEKNVAEDAAGVGVIANKKQAKDPRYSMSLTQDIRPGETERQLRKMHLK